MALNKTLSLGIILLALFRFAGVACAADMPRYLGFQIFTPAPDSPFMRENFPPAPNIAATMEDIRNRIGSVGEGNRHIAAILGPLSFDHTDRQIHELIADGFDHAIETGVPVGFHIDDSMFWNRLTQLNAPQNIEKVSWQGPPSEGRELYWNPAAASRIAPPLCLNSPDVQQAVRDRAALIGREIAAGIKTLRAKNKEALFAGVIAGWETQIGKDFKTGHVSGYCALANAGYGPDNPPAGMDEARAVVVREFIELWAHALSEAGVPRERIYSHVGMDADSRAAAFCPSCVPGTSTYPFPGVLSAWLQEVAAHQHLPWASSEGAALDPRDAVPGGRGESGISVEAYLGNLFNHGAVLVNIFGWGLGDAAYPFRKMAESPEALAAYRKFLRGEPLAEAPINDLIDTLPATLRDKIVKLRAVLPPWLETHGPRRVQADMEAMNRALQNRQHRDAEARVDAILATVAR